MGILCGPLNRAAAAREATMQGFDDAALVTRERFLGEASERFPPGSAIVAIDVLCQMQTFAAGE